MSIPLQLPSPSTSFGFACKVWIAYRLEARYLGRTYFAWFSRELNPIGNGDSANPLELYREIDRAVKKNDVNHPKLKDLKTNLLEIVSRVIAPRDLEEARELKRIILNAPVGMFRPQIWRLDLSKVQPQRWDRRGANQTWDEQFVADLRDDEFNVCVE